MKNRVIQVAQNYFQLVAREDLPASTKLFELSRPMLAMAALKEKNNYGIFFEKLLKNHEVQSSTHQNFQLWMWGRLLLAAQLQNDIPKLREYHRELSKRLNEYAVYYDDDQADLMVGWAYAHLASSNPTTYRLHQGLLKEYSTQAIFAYQRNIKEASNCITTLALNLYASAHALQREDYDFYLGRLRTLSYRDSLNEVMSFVPDEDHRHWLVSILRNAFQLRNDTESLNELRHNFPRKVETMGIALAWANELNLGTLNQPSAQALPRYNRSRFHLPVPLHLSHPSTPIYLVEEPEEVEIMLDRRPATIPSML